MYRYLSAPEKIKIVNRILGGEAIAKISREEKVSRTILYRWLVLYAKNKKRNPEEVFSSNRPKGEGHWRHVPEVKKQVLDIVKESPGLSSGRISKELEDRIGKQVVSSYGVHSVLKRLKLTKYPQRLAFAEAAADLGQNPAFSGIPESRVLTANTGKSYAGKLFVSLLAVSLFITSLFLLLYSLRLNGVEISSLTISKELSSISTIFNVSRAVHVSGISNSPLIAAVPAKADDSPAALQSASQAPDFSWGALAVNTDKAVYQIGEPVHFSIGILDQSGRTICYANLILKIIDPRSKTSFFSLRSGGIKMRQGCGSFTQEAADYYAEFAPALPGLYSAELIAETKKGVSSEKTTFLVSTVAPFSITWQAPARIYPPALYPVTMTVVAHQKYTGEIRQEVPSKFTILPLAGTESYQIIRRDASSSMISWLVSMKKGDTVRLGYLVQSPSASPAVYELLGLRLFDKSGLVFEEKKSWTIVIDSINSISK